MSWRYPPDPPRIIARGRVTRTGARGIAHIAVADLADGRRAIITQRDDGHDGGFHYVLYWQDGNDLVRIAPSGAASIETGWARGWYRDVIARRPRRLVEPRGTSRGNDGIEILDAGAEMAAWEGNGISSLWWIAEDERRWPSSSGGADARRRAGVTAATGTDGHPWVGDAVYARWTAHAVQRARERLGVEVGEEQFAACTIVSRGPCAGAGVILRWDSEWIVVTVRPPRTDEPTRA